jgi:hypothetical protein
MEAYQNFPLLQKTRDTLDAEYKVWYKKATCNGNVETNELTSDAVTVLQSATVDLLVQKPQFFICTRIKKKRGSPK